MPWRRESLPIPVFWPGELHGLASPWSRKDLDTTERLSLLLLLRSTGPKEQGSAVVVHRQYVESLQTRNQTQVSCAGWQTLNYWTTTEVLTLWFYLTCSWYIMLLGIFSSASGLFGFPLLWGPPSVTDCTTQGSRRKQMAYPSWAIQGKFNQSLIYKYVGRTPREVTGLVLGTLLGLKVGRRSRPEIGRWPPAEGAGSGGPGGKRCVCGREIISLIWASSPLASPARAPMFEPRSENGKQGAYCHGHTGPGQG